jgi:hypothetical protein
LDDQIPARGGLSILGEKTWIQTPKDAVPREPKSDGLGVGGAYIHCEQTLEPGESVTLRIQPPTGSPLTITAEVIWAGKVLALGVGVHFVEMSDQVRQFIAETVSKLLSDTGMA